MNLTYRLINNNDFDFIYDVYMDETANEFLTYDMMDKESFREIFSEILSSSTVFVAEAECEKIGTYKLVPKHHRQAHILYLGGFAVHKNHKGKGYGAQMLQHIKDEAAQKGLRRIELTVMDYNTAAIELYKKLNFVIEGHLRDAYVLKDHTYGNEYLMAALV